MSAVPLLRSISFPALAAALAAALLLGGGPLQAPAQEPQDPQQPIRVETRLVSIFATVRDGKRRIVPDLSQEDFRVQEDGKEQTIEFFSRETALPITLGLLVDTSISQDAVLVAEQEAASRFLRRVMRKGDLAFVISFDMNVDLLHDFSEDADRLQAAIQRARINSPLPEGPVQRSGPIGTKLYDAIWLACRQKLRHEVGRKALLILTDGVDAGSKVTLEEALETAQRTDTVIHVIGISDPGFYRGYGYGGESIARKLAEETGGRSIFVRNEKRLEEAFDQISEELRTQYTLGYVPTNRAPDGKFRRLKVETSRRGLKVLTRKGYYAPAN